MKKLSIVVQYNNTNERIEVDIDELSWITKEQVNQGSIIAECYGKIISGFMKLEYLE